MTRDAPQQRRQRRRNPARRSRQHTTFFKLSVALLMTTHLRAFVIRRSTGTQLRQIPDGQFPCKTSRRFSYGRPQSQSAHTDALLTHRPFTKVFDLNLPEGRCVGISIIEDSSTMKTFDSVPSEHWIHDYLHPEEIKYGLRLPASSNRISFFLGRLAMRSIVFQNDSYSNHVILRDEYGRPSLPAGFLGSISHKKATAVALAIEKHDTINMAVGVDLEYALDSKAGIATKVLRKEEIDSLGQVEGVSAAEEVLLRFSLKESLYKAMHPLLCRYIGFHEVQVQPRSDGTAKAIFHLPEADTFNNVTCHWRRVSNFFLSSASLQWR